MGPTDPILSKNKEIILQNIKTIIFSFLKKIRSKTQQTYINNQNQEAFIVVIINYELWVFSSVFAMQNI